MVWPEVGVPRDDPCCCDGVLPMYPKKQENHDFRREKNSQVSKIRFVLIFRFDEKKVDSAGQFFD